MNKTENDRIHELCGLIAGERDQHRLLSLVKELNGILSRRDAESQSNNLGIDPEAHQ